MTIEEKSMSRLVADWVAGQPFTNALLAMILVGIGWICWYSITVAVPKHLETIQSGYEKIDALNRAERELIRGQHEKWLDKVIDFNKRTTASPTVSGVSR